MVDLLDKSRASDRWDPLCGRSEWPAHIQPRSRRRRVANAASTEWSLALTATLEALNRNLRIAIQEERFKHLSAQWKTETKFLSNITARSMHIAYQKIIGMGQDAIPLILKELLDNGPDDWFWALHVITDANPVTEDMAGQMTLMAEAWIQWGRHQGYLPD